VRAADLLRLTTSAVGAQRLRAVLTALGIGIGVTAVVLLTSIGAGVHRFVLGEFTQFGTNIVSVAPGRTRTFGGSIGAFGNVRPLTVEDARALQRTPHVRAVNAAVQGNAEVEAGGRKRRTTINGVSAAFTTVFRFEVAQGEFLPADAVETPRALAVLGSRMSSELFGTANALGQSIRVGGQRYRVIGIMRSKGTTLGFDLDDTVFIPTAKALELFDRASVFEIQLSYLPGADADEVVGGLRRILVARHGNEDFTVTTQRQMLDTLGSVLGVLTFAVGALGSISLLVGGVGIFTIMTIGVRERTAEIGLLRALGARKAQVLQVFLLEAVALSALGAGLGLASGLGLVLLLDLAVPALPVSYAPDFMLLAVVLALLVGLIAGFAPAVRAAALEPVEALRAE